MDQAVRDSKAEAPPPILAEMRGIAGAALVVLAVVTACTTDERGLPTGRFFDNRTGQAVTVVWARQGGERITQATLQPGGTADVTMNGFGNPNDVCGDGDVVVLDTSGRELIRRPASCNRWVIRVPPVPRDRLTDRTWVLAAIVAADGSETDPIVPSAVVFASSGDFTFRTGCRTLEGQWQAGADEVGPTSLRVADAPRSTPCAGAAAAEDATVSEILRQPAAVQLVGQSLVLISNWSDRRDWQLRYELAQP